MDAETATPPPLRLAVLGCAEFAWRNTLPAVRRTDEVLLTVLGSRDGAKAARYAEEFGGEPVEGYGKVLERHDVDAVYIALPTGLHHAWARRALEAGKHVLVEKPLATGLAQTEDLVEEAVRRGCWLTDGFQFPHHGQHAQVRQFVDEGGIGEPRFFTAAFGIPPRPPGDVRHEADLGGGALLDVGVYTVRAARMFLGEDLTVRGSTLRMDTARGVDLGGSALLCSGGGVPAQLSFSFETSYRSSYALWGSEGALTLERAFTPPPAFRPTLLVRRGNDTQELPLTPDDQPAQLMRAFARAVREGASMTAHGEELRRQAALVDDIRNRALRTAIRL
ncbi:Gfo/Idh/MocA family protein [Streptomyces reniochalinae]|uniref:Gfo/Idh/MocA family oxidoreductase n=1 Tax=Streptomyces reniochalinae TaxID=2250578 RepID=A0A367E674_9ACTN|nr:Gfo/Idh/MocA family oxidoreductase [Streptomyces reniochalinae]RCG13282.1 gfo/Idh/MocA family oxidoreductase [Streptomyces reniochalinae]